MKRKKSPLTLAKDKAWAEFSKFIRTRDCIRTANSLEHGACISCMADVPYKKSQAGHFIAGRTNNILLYEELVHLKCYHCNIGLSGNYVEYFIAMEKLYTRDEIDILRMRKNETKKMTIDGWNDAAAWYKIRTQRLIAQFNVNKYGILLKEMTAIKKTLTPIDECPKQKAKTI